MMPSTVNAGTTSSGTVFRANRSPMPSAARTTPAWTDQRMRPNGAPAIRGSRPGTDGREFEKVSSGRRLHVRQQILVRLHAIENLRVDIHLHPRLPHPSPVVHDLARHGPDKDDERQEPEEQPCPRQDAGERIERFRTCG